MEINQSLCWQRQCEYERISGKDTSNVKTGRAFMVYSSNNEQKLDFLVLGNTWEPIDLMA